MSLKFAGARAVAGSAVGNVVSGAQSAAKGTLNEFRGEKKGQIIWDDFNYPPFVRLIHYSLDELQDPIRSVVKKMHLVFLLVLVINAINRKYF
jgi:hypothetical protein